jgi:tetratricopeptide (TPR) repeat protein
MNYNNLLENRSPIPLNVIGVEKADMGELEMAIRYFTEAIEIDPDDPRAYFNRATLKIKLGDIQGARNDFINAKRLTK